MRPFLFAAGALAILSAAAAPALASTTYNYTGAGQTFTVPTTGLYTIVAYGASGGSAQEGAGGLGAEIGDTFNLTVGDVLQIDVGAAADMASRLVAAAAVPSWWTSRRATRSWRLQAAEAAHSTKASISRAAIVPL